MTSKNVITIAEIHRWRIVAGITVAIASAFIRNEAKVMALENEHAHLRTDYEIALQITNDHLEMIAVQNEYTLVELTKIQKDIEYLRLNNK